MAAMERLHTAEETGFRENRLRLALQAGEIGCWELDLATGQAMRSARFFEVRG